MDGGRRPPGRPRTAGADGAILAATLRILAEQGYDRTSLEAVAAEADVARATIYRRWPTKADLVAAAIGCLAAEALEAPSDDPRRFLVDALTGMRDHMERFGCLAIVGSLLARQGEHPEMLEGFRERVIRPARGRVRAGLERAAAAGLVRPDADLDAAVAMLLGAYFAESLAGRDTGGNWPERVVAELWAALAPRAAAAR
jgi:AcrR family transcriptional regulator